MDLQEPLDRQVQPVQRVIVVQLEQQVRLDLLELPVRLVPPVQLELPVRLVPPVQLEIKDQPV